MPKAGKNPGQAMCIIGYRWVLGGASLGGSGLGGGGPLVVGMVWGMVVGVRGVGGPGIGVEDVVFFLVVRTRGHGRGVSFIPALMLSTLIAASSLCREVMCSSLCASSCYC